MTDENENGKQKEIKRIFRVSDMLCSAHASMRDRYQRRAFVIGTCTLGVSTWLVALIFVEDNLATVLTPFNLSPKIWLGILGAGTFFSTVFQMKVNWGGSSVAHARSLALYADVKRRCRYVLAEGDSIPDTSINEILTRYDLASELGQEIPERYFLKEKRKHRVKLILSDCLDENPASSILLMKTRLLLRDNFKKCSS